MHRPRRTHPNLIELNAFAFMDRLRRERGAGLTLSTVPTSVWEDLGEQGFSLVWLMGVWKRSPGSRACALSDPGLRQAYDRALPGWTEDDVLGSPYAVFSYEVDPRLGSTEDLLLLRKTLGGLGMGLILDFVPNHLAIDHPWTARFPERFVRGSEAGLRNDPGLFFTAAGGAVLAHGKDPYFPPWSDTVQLDHSSPEARDALIAELERIAALCDGVRCDMAMLVLNDVFRKNWGGFLPAAPAPETEFWSDAIRRVKTDHPSFLFIAEAYWGLEPELQHLGFDYTYDKKLYDLMLHASAREVKAHLSAEEAFQEKCVRFVENHDEKPAVKAFGRERSLAAAAIAATAPGLHLFHEGQTGGLASHLPVQLARRAGEREDPVVGDFYRRLLSFSSGALPARRGWTPLDVKQAWEGDYSSENLLSWAWHGNGSLKIVCVNFSDETSRARLRIPPDFITPGPLTFRDAATDEIYVRTTEEILGGGLFVELAPWKAHLLDLLS